ncbi:cytochrome P450 [Diaporthe sp. PMI_573]|nr:cytochrome P450 [Diaporthaceae sp. PMI_573]
MLLTLETAGLPQVSLRLLTIGALAITCIASYNYIRVLLLRRRLPPGPFPLPVIGNHFRIPYWQPWVKFEEWSREYANPMITIWLGSRPVIVLNDAWTASDLLEKRADVYSSRPRFVAMGELTGSATTNQATLVYGDKWRLHRKLTHSIVGSHVVRDHRSFQGDESKILTLDFLTDPDDYVMSIERYSVSVVSIIGWGRRIAKKNDYVCQKALETMAVVNFVIPGWLLVETLPWLANLPPWLYAFPTIVRTISSHLAKYFYALNKEAAANNLNPSFAKDVLEKQPSLGLSDDEVSALTTNLLGAGVDTTSGTLTSAILALCLFPEVQAKAQAEMDTVLGGRSPTWEDLDGGRLPYTSALAREILRWRTVTILGGIPHAPVCNDTYRGYLIPKGIQLTCNTWAIHRNPGYFPEPDAVRPERYLGDNPGGLAFEYPNSRGHNAFGWGRRQCSGQPLADQSVSMVVARLVWAFKVEPGLDEKGNPVQLSAFAYNDSENIRPLPFKARFTPRSSKIEELIRSEAREAAQRLSIFDGDTKLTLESVLANQEKL